MTRRYNPAIHDPILTELNQKLGRSDPEIAEAMGLDKTTIRNNRIRLGLPTNYAARTAHLPSERTSPTHAPRSNPVEMAELVLGQRLETRPAGFFLDRVPVSLTTLMKETNRIRVKRRMEQIGPEIWRV